MRPLDKLREKMKQNKVDMYIYFNTDPHISEYVGDYYRGIKYLTGFSGSNATIIVTENEAGLWTDGRYFVQADKEISQSGFKLFKMNMKGYPSVNEYIQKNLKRGKVLAADGRLLTRKDCEEYQKIVDTKRAKFLTEEFLVDEIWENRPKLKCSKPWILTEEFSGERLAAKLKRIRRKIREKGGHSIVLNDLCDIAWVLNLRGDDIEYVPVFYSYLYISLKDMVLFIGENTLDKNVLEYLREETADNICIKPLNDIYSFLSALKNEKILVNKDSINASIVKSGSNCEYLYTEKTIEHMRAVKNKTEASNIEKSHINDGVALTKVIYHLKKYAMDNGELLGEYDVVKMLTEYRSKQEYYVEDSFDSIVAYKENAAMMHYAPHEDTQAKIKRESFLLIDSGGHYLTGTTDVTRTIAMGYLSDEEKYNYTRVLKAHLSLMDVKFPKGATGENLDIISRMPFWSEADDYLSGTGHGVGYLLSVHEGPNAISWRYKSQTSPIVPGMLTTDEPGYYEDNAYGIRIENELLCISYKKSKYNEYYRFKPMTFVPYETDAIITDMLSDSEIAILNRYNRLVYKTLSKYLSYEENIWLKQVTARVKRNG